MSGQYIKNADGIVQTTEVCVLSTIERVEPIDVGPNVHYDYRFRRLPTMWNIYGSSGQIDFGGIFYSYELNIYMPLRSSRGDHRVRAVT